MIEETPDVSFTFRLDAFNEEHLLRSILNAHGNSPQSIIKRPFSASSVPLAISIIICPLIRTLQAPAKLIYETLSNICPHEFL